MRLSQYPNYIKRLRAAKELHRVVQDQVAALMKAASADFLSIREVYGLAGGRNDLLSFDYSGKKVVVEIFASVGQVSRDLRILDNTKANVKIAVIIDREVDAKVFDKFIRENPENNYSFLFIGEFLQKERHAETVLKLQSIVFKKETYRLHTLLKEQLSFTRFLALCKKDGIDVAYDPGGASTSASFKTIFMALLGHKLYRTALDTVLVREVMKFVAENEVFQSAMMRVQLGLNVMLFTDLHEHVELTNDVDLLDWLRIYNEVAEPHILVSINSIVHDIDKRFFSGKLGLPKELSIYVGQSTVIQVSRGVEVTFSIPRKTRKITGFRPMIISKNGAGEKTRDVEYYRKLMDIM